MKMAPDLGAEKNRSGHSSWIRASTRPVMSPRLSFQSGWAGGMPLMRRPFGSFPMPEAVYTVPAGPEVNRGGFSRLFFSSRFPSFSLQDRLGSDITVTLAAALPVLSPADVVIVYIGFPN